MQLDFSSYLIYHKLVYQIIILRLNINFTTNNMLKLRCSHCAERFCDPMCRCKCHEKNWKKI